MYPDQLPKLRYTDPMLQYVEYHAINRFCANGDFDLMMRGYPELSGDLPDIEIDFILMSEDDYRNEAMELLRNGAFDNTISTFALANVYRFLDSEGDIVPEQTSPIEMPLASTIG